MPVGTKLSVSPIVAVKVAEPPATGVPPDVSATVTVGVTFAAARDKAVEVLVARKLSPAKAAVIE